MGAVTDPSDTPFDAGSAAGPEAGLAAAVGAAWPLLVSIGLLMVGSGLQGALLGVRADAVGFDAVVVGAVLGGYYVGYIVGSAWVPSLLRSVGHIRVFAAFASMASASVLIHGVWVQPIPWLILRFSTGVFVAGLFVVSESWLTEVSTSRTRATTLGVYNTVITLGLATGSLLLNVADAAGVVLFVVGSVLLSLAAVPVALAPVHGPVPRVGTPLGLGALVRRVPLGVVGCTVAGMGTGVALGYGAVYAQRAGFGIGGASSFLVAVLGGAAVGQVPLGRLSDRTDRRRVMVLAAVLIAGGAGIGLAATSASSLTMALGAGALIGAGSFSLYGLAFAHTADYLEAEEMVSAGSRLITVNGLGAASGPVSGAAVVSAFGAGGYFGLQLAVAVVFGVIVVIRISVRAAAARAERAHYTPVATGATVAAVDALAEAVLAEVATAEPPHVERAMGER